MPPMWRSVADFVIVNWIFWFWSSGWFKQTNSLMFSNISPLITISCRIYIMSDNGINLHANVIIQDAKSATGWICLSTCAFSKNSTCAVLFGLLCVAGTGFPAQTSSCFQILPLWPALGVASLQHVSTHSCVQRDRQPGVFWQEVNSSVPGKSLIPHVL